ncbi:MAG: glycoside hydrolase family 13 protein [Oscillospiraceae bacterium]|nr:glycoside hydrolase family 13 protein [Oscillospiraceae bacterium]
MSNPIGVKIFDSRDSAYRNPVGAVEEGTQIHFKVCVPRHLCASAVTLRIRNEHTAETGTGNMFWCGMEGESHEWWEVDFTPPTSGLWFYHFDIAGAAGGSYKISRAWGSVGEITPALSEWQLSVWESGYTVPNWLEGGIIYQIFPDRFAKSGEIHNNVPSDRIIHHSFDEPVDWRPNSEGKILNNDYFGGDLEGIRQHLPRIKELGATCIYLNPIFEAHENHRYNTACYERIDPLLGTEEDFRRLCKEAEKLGIKIILDGVFSHTGADSVYFNKTGRYEGGGAFNSPDSPYRSWYKFTNWPHEYHSWWGIITLPEVVEEDENYLDYICGKDGILRRWLRAGASGWRLDVADELPDIFLDRLRAAVKEEKPDALIMGEVWEDATNKVAYSVRRRYLFGKQLDSVMNYPFKDAVLGFVTGWDAKAAMETILSVVENYPPQVLHSLMNLVGSHDTMRVLTLLAGEPLRGQGREWQSLQKMSPDAKARGANLLRLATVMQYTLPGVPSIYYGDEAGVEGYLDPFCRSPYPWGKENADLLEWYVKLGELRASLPCLKNGEFASIHAERSFISYTRTSDEEAILVALNAAWNEEQLLLPDEFIGAECLLGEYDGNEILRVAATSFVVLRVRFPI